MDVAESGDVCPSARCGKRLPERRRMSVVVASGGGAGAFSPKLNDERLCIPIRLTQGRSMAKPTVRCSAAYLILLVRQVRASFESGKSYTLRIDRQTQYDPSRNKSAKCPRSSDEEQTFGALSGQLGCHARGPAESRTTGSLTATLGIEPEAESR